jgi:hypothetical protein
MSPVKDQEAAMQRSVGIGLASPENEKPNGKLIDGVNEPESGVAIEQ